MTLTVNSRDFDLNMASSLSNDELFSYLESISCSPEFCKSLFSTLMTSPSSSILRIIYSALHIQKNYALKEEIISYFGLPIFTQLSDMRKFHEFEISLDERLKQAVSNISSIMMKSNNDSNLKLQSELFPKILDYLIISDDRDFIEIGLKLLIILLLQPSCRRFCRPLIADTLFLSVMKSKLGNLNLLQELYTVFFYPINEVNGVQFESHEEYVAAHFSKIRSLQSKFHGNPSITSLSKLSSINFNSREKIYLCLSTLSPECLNDILSIMGCSSYSKDLAREILVDSIIDNLVLREPFTNENISAFPTEVNLNQELMLRPLTTECLSNQDLFDRHTRILQNYLFHDLSEHVNSNIEACKPVLNSLKRTEFSSCTRDAVEVVSSAIVKTSCPDVQKQGKYQKIELEVSISVAPLDQITLKSWLDLKSSDVVFVSRVDAKEDGGFDLKSLRSVLLESRIITKSTLTFRFLVDPIQFDMDQRTEIYGNINLIIKRLSKESNDVRILNSISAQRSQKLPEAFEDVLLGISNPDDLSSLDLEVSSYSYDSSSLSFDQLQAVETCLKFPLSICEGPFGSGCTTVLKNVTKSLYDAKKNVTIIFRSGRAVDQFFNDLVKIGIPDHHILRLGFSSTLSNINQKYNEIIKRTIETINQDILSGLDSNLMYSCGESDFIMRSIIQPRWEAFRILLESEGNTMNIAEYYPFAKCLKFDNQSLQYESHYNNICSIFSIAKQLAPLELLQNDVNISKYVLGNLSKIVIMTSKYAAINSKSLSENCLNFDTLLIDDCNLIPEIEALLTLTAQANTSNLKRVGLFGHEFGGRPQCFNEVLRESGATVTLMDRFISSGFTKTTHLSGQPNYQSLWYKFFKSPEMPASKIFKNSVQFVHVPSILGKGEEMPMRNYIQNLDEAEYAVAVFQLLRLKGIPCGDIAILTAYKGQVDLIEEILQTRCDWTNFYSKPGFVGTIDQSSGLHFKYVITSLVRTKSVGFLSDETRLELASTRATDNLIILGSAGLFASENKFFNTLVSKTGTKLQLIDGIEFDNVESISKYVYNLSLETIQ